MLHNARRRLGAVAAVIVLLGAAACESKSESDDGPAAASGEPIVVGSTLSLSGAFAATGAIHKIAGEAFVDRLNKEGGLLGRPVTWTVRDDESDQAKVSTLYEQLITQDKVDLIIGPYATPNILSAMAVAARHKYTMPQHTAVIAPLLTYECQFPAWSIGPTPNQFVPTQLYEAVGSLPNPPKRIAILTNQNGSTDFVSYGAGNNKTGAVSITRSAAWTWCSRCATRRRRPTGRRSRHRCATPSLIWSSTTASVWTRSTCCRPWRS
jgi:branched-chain amino acid transport system substrate-binding protein